jgi:general secretion pathway protein J
MDIRFADRRRRGFTLIELLVAIGVLAMVSLIAWRGLDSLVHTRERLQPEAEEVRALLVAFGQIERDLAQLVSTALVPLQSAPLAVRGGAPVGFELLRLAPAGGGQPSALQWVIYELRDGQLLRRASAPINTFGPPPATMLPATPLLTDVQALRVRLWQPGRGWAPAQTIVLANPRAVPPGIEIVVEFADGREYRRVMLVG